MNNKKITKIILYVLVGTFVLSVLVPVITLII